MTMDGLMRIALAGTGQEGGATIAVPPPLEELASGLPDGPAERKLLLLAGALAVYRQAGYVAPAAPAAPEPAPEEDWPACSPRAARLVEGVLNGQSEPVLLEALGLLRLHRQRLPFTLLPQALGAQSLPVRTALTLVAGRRGEWLSRLNPAWKWLTDMLVSTTARDPARVRAVWEEGTPEQRLAVLRRIRTEKPAEARQWAADVWRTERAEYRISLLHTLVNQLSADDEAFLEAALDDRSAGVREQAARMLARLPGSAYAGRMAERGDLMLDGVRQGSADQTSTPSTELGDRSAPATWRIAGRPPIAFDDGWTRDGISRKPPLGIGERAWWLIQILAFAPLAHWEERFAATPAALIAAVRQYEWRSAVMHGWARAAIGQENPDWAAVLWDRLSQEVSANEFSTAATLGRALVAVMRQDDAERRVTAIMEAVGHDLTTGVRWVDTLQALPQPWSAPFGATYLALLRRHVAALTTLGKYAVSPWLMTLPIAAVALPPGCFSEALQPLAIPEADPAHGDRYRAQLRTFTDTIDRRRQLREEIT